MWNLISLENPDKKYVLLGERSYAVGRRDCDILVTGDPTVSRKHAELIMSHPEANLVNLNKLPVLLLKDLSKFGTWVNKVRVSGEKLLSDGDEITFGSEKSVYTVVYEPFVITSSCLDNAAKKSVRHQLCILGGHMVNEWSNDCTLVVMNKISVTIKVICALVSLKSIVLPGYLEQYVKYLQGTSEKPDPLMYLPELGETQLDANEVSFAPDNRRKTLFLGMKFVFLSQKQLKKLNQAIELAGGMALLMETAGDDGMLTEPGTVVMNYQEPDPSPKTAKWVKHVKDLLERSGKHMIQDAEIGYAVLYSSTEKHCNPDYTPDRDLSKLPSQSLSQADVFVASTETQHRTQGKSQRNVPFTNIESQRAAKTPAKSAKTLSPDPAEKSSQHNHPPSPARSSPPPAEVRKSSRGSQSPSPTPTETRQKKYHGRAPSPAKPNSSEPSKRRRTGRHGRSPSPGEQVEIAVKEEAVSQPQSTLSSKKRNRPVIDEDSSDEEIPAARGNKRVKVEPETPKSKTGATEKHKASAAAVFAADTDSDDNGDEFDKIDARMNSRRKRQTSPKPQGQRSPRVSPVRQTDRNVSRSPSPCAEAGTKTGKTIKTEEIEDSVPDRSRSGSQTGLARSVEVTDEAAGGSRSGLGRVRKTEIESDDFQMSSVVPVEDSEDVKPNTVKRDVPVGFLTTRKPIEDQVQRNLDFQTESDQPSNCVKVEYASLVARKQSAKGHDTTDCPDGFTRWKGKVVKNFKKFRKAHRSVEVGLPTIIGGSDLEVYVPHRSKEMDDWFRETMQSESQHASDERRAQELFDFDPSRRRGR